jgi:hypothetical protein
MMTFKAAAGAAANAAGSRINLQAIKRAGYF